MSFHNILVRNMNNGLQGTETFYQQITQAPLATGYILDLKQVRFLQPTNLLALVIGSRYLSKRCRIPIRITNLDDKVLLYLERMNFFSTGKEWIELDKQLPEDRWSRNPSTDNLLELSLITSHDDVLTIVARTAQICQPLELPNLSQILQTLSELCSNVAEHSGDQQGCALIQRYYNYQLRTKIVCIAIGDMGRGIPGSLIEKFGEFEERPVGYLLAALNGKSSRATKRGGLGLQTIEHSVAEEGGALWLRSETAAVFSRGVNLRRTSELPVFVPGTQVVVELTG